MRRLAPKGLGSWGPGLAIVIALAAPAHASHEPGAADSAAAPIRLSGVLALDDPRLREVACSGAWMFPVGDPIELVREKPVQGSRFYVSRGIERDSRGRVTHHGADLINGRAGDSVRAAANGIVLQVSERAADGYGLHVVLAHRTPEDGWVFSVYSHLARGSTGVRVGEPIRAGELIGRVGRTGRATANHLHFEVRIPRRLEDPWQKATPGDPIDWIEARLPAHRGDTTWAAPYLSWAEETALITPETRPTDRLSRAEWWRMLARAARAPISRLPRDPDSLRRVLETAGVVTATSAGSPRGEVGWDEFVSDLRRLGARGTRLPAAGIPADTHASMCTARLGSRPVSFDVPDPRRTADRPLLVSDACLAIADASEAGRADAAVATDPAPTP